MDAAKKASNPFRPIGFYPAAMLYHIQINVPMETDLPAMHNLLKRQGSSFVSLKDETSEKLKSTDQGTDSRAANDTRRAFFGMQRSFTVSFESKS